MRETYCATGRVVVTIALGLAVGYGLGCVAPAALYLFAVTP